MSVGADCCFAFIPTWLASFSLRKENVGMVLFVGWTDFYSSRDFRVCHLFHTTTERMALAKSVLVFYIVNLCTIPCVIPVSNVFGRPTKSPKFFGKSFLCYSQTCRHRHSYKN